MSLFSQEFGSPVTFRTFSAICDQKIENFFLGKILQISMDYTLSKKMAQKLKVRFHYFFLTFLMDFDLLNTNMASKIVYMDRFSRYQSIYVF